MNGRARWPKPCVPEALASSLFAWQDVVNVVLSKPPNGTGEACVQPGAAQAGINSPAFDRKAQRNTLYDKADHAALTEQHGKA